MAIATTYELLLRYRNPREQQCPESGVIARPRRSLGADLLEHALGEPHRQAAAGVGGGGGHFPDGSEFSAAVGRDFLVVVLAGGVDVRREGNVFSEVVLRSVLEALEQ